MVDSLPISIISESELKPCDALRHLGEGTAGHVAMFLGWHSPGVPWIAEECGHFSDCCGGAATCPGKCGSATNCNEYCPGCPIQQHIWADGLRGFQPIRRHGWS